MSIDVFLKRLDELAKEAAAKELGLDKIDASTLSENDLNRYMIQHELEKNKILRKWAEDIANGSV